jgi:glycosyltransferase involved in cell wall biosynthesis
LICGGDEDKAYRKYLNELVMKLDLVESVMFMGFVEKPTDMYKISDAVLVCSRNEAWGRVSAEAMIHGKPVIGYKSGGTQEIITDNITGLLYENTEELSSCMKTVICDKELVNKMIINAKKSVLEKYNKSRYVENVFQIISKVVK